MNFSRVGMPMCFAVQALIVRLNWLFFSSILPAYLQPRLGDSFAHAVATFWAIMIAGGEVHFWRCCLVDPGYTTPGRCQHHDDELGQQAWCDKCNCAKPARAHHCRSCGRCVLLMDHHCMWMDTCVGVRNYDRFLLQEAYFGLAALLITPCTFLPLFALLGPGRMFSAAKMHALTWLPIAILMCFVLRGVLGCILLHVRLLAVGRTTIEHLFNSGGTDAADNVAERHPVDSTKAKVWLEEVFCMQVPRRWYQMPRLGMACLWFTLVHLHETSERFRKLVRAGSN